MRNPFKKSRKQLLEQNLKIQEEIRENVQKLRNSIIEHILLLDEHYVVEPVGKLEKLSLEQLEQKLRKYLDALREDVGITPKV